MRVFAREGFDEGSVFGRKETVLWMFRPRESRWLSGGGLT